MYSEDKDPGEPILLFQVTDTLILKLPEGGKKVTLGRDFSKRMSVQSSDINVRRIYDLVGVLPFTSTFEILEF